MFQLITPGVVPYTITNIFVKMCFIRREMRHSILPVQLAMPTDFPSNLGDGSESLI